MLKSCVSTVKNSGIPCRSTGKRRCFSAENENRTHGLKSFNVRLSQGISVKALNAYEENQLKRPNPI